MIKSVIIPSGVYLIIDKPVEIPRFKQYIQILYNMPRHIYAVNCGVQVDLKIKKMLTKLGIELYGRAKI